VIKKIIKAWPIIPLLLVVFYVGGVISQFVENYKIWKNDNMAFGTGYPKFPDFNIVNCMKSSFSYPYGLIGLAICVVGAVVLAFVIMKMGSGDSTDVDRERNFEYSSKGTYGTSEFMTNKEMKEVFEVDSIKNNDGILLGSLKGKEVFLPKDTFMNKNIAVFGASGSMKSRAFVRNYIFQAVRRGESVVLTDPKSELYEDLAEYLKNNGYDVKVFNLISPEHSDSWNCIGDINGDDLLAQTFTDVVIKNTTMGKSDQFWDSASTNLLKALVLYVSTKYEGDKKTIGEAYRLLCITELKELDGMFSILDYDEPAYAPYRIFKQSSDTVRSSIIVGLGARLQIFQNKMIRNITSYDEINLTEAGLKKCAYFCITSDQQSTFDFMGSLFFSFLFIKLVGYADNYGYDGKLPVPVNFVLDEFPNIGAIPDFKKKISTTRSRGINISVIFQSLAQLKNRYPDDVWQEILGNCDTQLFLGCTDETTAKLVSDRTGDITVGVESNTKELNTWRVSDYTPQYRSARSIGKRKLMTPDEVLRLPHQKALVMMRGHKVLKIDKFDYTNHPHANQIIKKKASSYTPQWMKYESITDVNDKVKKDEVIDTPKRITLSKPEVTSPNPPKVHPTLEDSNIDKSSNGETGKIIKKSKSELRVKIGGNNNG